MNETNLKTKPPGSGGWLRKLIWIAGILVVLLIVAYFVVSSGAFVKGVVMPRVAKALNADLVVSDVELSPLSSLVLRDVKLTPKGAETLLTASLVRVRYSLFSIMGGKIAVEEITIESPTVTIVENAEGKSNLDPLLAGQKAGAKEAVKSSGKSSAPPNVDVKSVALKNATVRRTKNLKGGGRESFELSNVNVTLANLKNGATGKLDFSAALAMDNTAPGNAGKLLALLTGSFSFDLTSALQPAMINGKAAFNVNQAAGNFSDLAALAAQLNCEATPTEVKQIALRFTQSGQALGELRAGGPFDAAKSEGRLNVAVLALDRRVLNLFGAASGIDFDTTVINSTNVVTLSKGGSFIAATGQLDAVHVRITRQGQSTPTIDLRGDYAVTVDRTAQTALLQSLNVIGTQNSQPLLRGDLSSPMTIAFGQNTAAGGDAALNLTLTSLNLADWRAFAPDLAPEGMANAKLKLLSQDGGKQMSLELDGQLTGLAARVGVKPLRNLNTQVQVRVARKQAGGVLAGRIALSEISGRYGENSFDKLAGTLAFDVGMKEKRIALNQCQLTLTPTTRAKNELRLTGTVDLTRADAISGSLKFAADTLDATAYYDAFTGKVQPVATATPATPASSDNTEPAPVKLPFNNFTVEAGIGRFYLREVDAQNFQLVAKLDGSHVLLKPAQLTLNGAPISASADLDLSVPGFKYDVTFSANGVPVEPLANSFSPTYSGQAKGTLIASAQLKGAGVTGRNLKNSLAGQADLSFTNAHIQIVGPKMKAVLTPIAFVLGAPELLRSPLDYLTASLRAGGGKIEVPAFVAHSESFRADSQGVIPIADVLNDSPLNQNIEVSLARDLANKLRFTNVPTNVAYMKLPTFVHLKGTLGSPDPKTDKLVILGLTASGIGGAIGGRAGSLIGNVGSLLGGKPAPVAVPDTNRSPATATTNAPASNVQPKPQNPVGGLLDLFKKPKK